MTSKQSLVNAHHQSDDGAGEIAERELVSASIVGRVDGSVRDLRLHRRTVRTLLHLQDRLVTKRPFARPDRLARPIHRAMGSFEHLGRGRERRQPGKERRGGQTRQMGRRGGSRTLRQIQKKVNSWLLLTLRTLHLGSSEALPGRLRGRLQATRIA